MDAALKVLGINKSPGGEGQDSGRIISSHRAWICQNPIKTMSTNTENKRMAYRLDASLYIPVFKKGGATEDHSYRTIALLPHPRKVVLKGTWSFYLIWSRNAGSSSWIRRRKRNSDLIVSTYWEPACSREFQKKVSLLTDAVKPSTVDDEKL